MEETVTCMVEDPLPGAGLLPVTLADQARFSHHFASLTEPLSDYTFSQLFTWSNSLRIFWKEIRGHLCVFANGTGDLTLLLPPIGEGDAQRALLEAFQIMDEYNCAHQAHGHSRVEYVSEELLRRLDRSRLQVQPMGADYVYDVARMIDLAGADLASKRQLRARFLRNYQYRVELYDAARHESDCLRLLADWKQFQDAHQPSDRATDALKRRKETLACELALHHAAMLGLSGLVVHVRDPARPAGAGAGDDWRLAGFTLGEPLGRRQSSIVIEKTDLSVRGLAQFIFSEFCRRCWADRPLVNAGDDWGIPTLAWTKRSYRPVRMLQKYMLRLAPVAAIVVPAAFAPQAAEAPCAAGDVQIRPARLTDIPAAVELERSCFSVYCLNKRQLSRLQRSSQVLFLVAEREGRIVGQGISLVRQHQRWQSGRIYSLAVAAAERGRGVGRRLLNALIDGLAARGVRRIFLEVQDCNHSALRLYERNGFRRIGDLPDYYGPGRHGAHLMRLIEPAPAPQPRPQAQAALLGC